MSTRNLDFIQPGASIYFLGIGGIGMSALARYLHHAGCRVRGYDRTETPLTRNLVLEGIGVDYDFTTDWFSDTAAVIWTPAVKDHPALVELRHRDIPILKRAELLGAISATMPTLAIAGTHGKTTTSAMTAHLLRHAGLDPVAFVGGIMANYQSNLLLGRGKWLVCEADEYDRSFLQLRPQHAVISSIDADHLDIYGDSDSMQATYAEFAQQVSGQRWYSEQLAEWSTKHQVPGQLIGMGQGATVRITDVRSHGLQMQFAYVNADTRLNNLVLNMPGVHNVHNAAAAITLALAAGVPATDIAEGLASFQGVERRFQVHVLSDTLCYVDDYAHHPTELSAALSAAKAALPGFRVIAAFQPHLFTRTRDFLEGFAEALSAADAVLVLPIYPARENPIPGVSSEALLDRITTRQKHLVGLSDLSQAIGNWLHEDPTVVLTLGAGDIDTQVAAVKQTIASHLTQRKQA